MRLQFINHKLIAFIMMANISASKVSFQHPLNGQHTVQSALQMIMEDAQKYNRISDLPEEFFTCYQALKNGQEKIDQSLLNPCMDIIDGFLQESLQTRAPRKSSSSNSQHESCSKTTLDTLLCAIKECCENQQQSCGIAITSLPAVIDTPGSYFLSGTFTLSDQAPAITITTSNVCLDLCCNTIIGNGTSDGILIQSSGNRKVHKGIEDLCTPDIVNVTIKNGRIDSMLNNGIQAENVQNLQCENLTITRCNNGFNLVNCQNSCLKESIASNNRNHGFFLNNSCQFPPLASSGCTPCLASCNRNNLVIDCQALSTRNSEGDAYGFRSICGRENSFVRCIAKDTNTDGSFIAAGFSLEAQECTQVVIDQVAPTSCICEETNSKILDCTASDTSATGALGRAIGMQLKPLFASCDCENICTQSLDFGPNQSQRQQIRIIDSQWSPNGCYFATLELADTSTTTPFTGNTSSGISIFTIDKEQGMCNRCQYEICNPVPNSTISDIALFDLAWSSDSTFLAVAAKATFTVTGPTESGFLQIINPKEGSVCSVITQCSPVAPIDPTIMLLAWSPSFSSNRDTLALTFAGQELGTPSNLSGLRIYNFDPENLSIFPTTTCIDFTTACDGTTSLTGTRSISAPAWSPDGDYLALTEASSDSARLRIFNIAKSSPASTICSDFPSCCELINGISSIQNLLISATEGSFATVVNYNDGSNKAVVFVAEKNKACEQSCTTTISGTISSLAWSAQGTYVLLQIDATPDSLILFNTKTCQNVCTNQNTVIQVPAWSPDGSFFAYITRDTVASVLGPNTLRIFSFDPETSTCSEVCTEILNTDCQGTESNTFARGVAWSHDGTRIAVLYVVVDSNNKPTKYIQKIFSVDQTTGECTEICCEEFNPTQQASNSILNSFSLLWAPDDCYLASANNYTISINALTLPKALVNISSTRTRGPQNCVVENNLVTGARARGNGIGIRSNCYCLACTSCGCNNLIIKNTSFDNDIPYKGVAQVVEGTSFLNAANLAYQNGCN